MRFKTRIGYKKKNCWSFQKEARFVLILMHTVPEMRNGVIIVVPNYCFTEYGLPPIDCHGNELRHYDLKVDNDAFDYMEVIAGPETNEQDKTIIKNLLRQFAPKAKFKNSTLRTRFNK